jgi:hypothetical protein
MMKLSTLLSFAAFLNTGIVTFGGAQVASDDTVTSMAVQGSISLVRLISNPDRFENAYVQTGGYLHYRFEDCALYISKTEADYLHGLNAVWVTFAESVKMVSLTPLPHGARDDSLACFDGKYVSVRGRLNRLKKGHMGAFAATLEDVEVIREDRQWYDGRKSLWEDQLDGKGLRPVNPDAPH